MGQASKRGTREERVAAAIAAGREKVEPERQYRPRLAYRNSMLDYLWGQFKVIGDVTIREIHEQARAHQQKLAMERIEERKREANLQEQQSDRAQTSTESTNGSNREPTDDAEKLGIDIERTPFRTGGILETEPCTSTSEAVPARVSEEPGSTGAVLAPA